MRYTRLCKEYWTHAFPNFSGIGTLKFNFFMNISIKKKISYIITEFQVTITVHKVLVPLFWEIFFSVYYCPQMHSQLYLFFLYSCRYCYHKRMKIIKWYIYSTTVIFRMNLHFYLHSFNNNNTVPNIVAIYVFL